MYDRTTGDIGLVSVSSDGDQGNLWCGDSPEISQDGRYIVFESVSNNLVPNDTNEVSDIFIHDLTTGETTRESIDSLGQELYYVSRNPSISADGRYVGFVVQKIDQKEHLYVRDRYTGQLTLISVNMDGLPSDDDSYYRWISHKINADGRFVVFSSDASDLVPGDTNDNEDVFVHILNPPSSF